jgi:cyclohexa-1,5-dienecarbonyl-CoA hydratase
MQEFKNISFAESEGIARITLRRPPLNILNIEMMGEINWALESLRGRDDVKAIAFFAEGKAFSAGVDVGEHTGDKVRDMIYVFHKMFRLLDEVGITSVAVVGGSALGGGCELATFCDIVIASENAKFGQPEIQVGVFPPVACAVFPKIIGRKKALELILTGDIISAQEALKIGLVNKVVAPEKLNEEAEAFLSKLKSLSALVLKLTRRAAVKDFSDLFKKQLEKIEEVYFEQLMQTHDAEEGLKAFLEKRKPQWKNT